MTVPSPPLEQNSPEPRIQRQPTPAAPATLHQSSNHSSQGSRRDGSSTAHRARCRRAAPRREVGKARRSRTVTRGLLRYAVFTVLAVVVLRTFVAQTFVIPSASMWPTLHGCPGCTDDHVIVERITERLRDVTRGDIVVFDDAQHWLPPAKTASASAYAAPLHKALGYVGLGTDTTPDHLIKRVIGVPGDTVEGRGGHVYVNGVLLREPYLPAGSHGSDIAFKVTVPAGKLWVMGDNRSESADSRAHRNQPSHGFIDEDAVVGRAIAIAWPPSRARYLQTPQALAAIPTR